MGEETETIDKLFLELSQFTNAKTGAEIRCEKRIAELKDIVKRSNKASKLEDLQRIAELERERDRLRESVRRALNDCSSYDQIEAALYDLIDGGEEE